MHQSENELPRVVCKRIPLSRPLYNRQRVPPSHTFVRRAFVHSCNDTSKSIRKSGMIRTSLANLKTTKSYSSSNKQTTTPGTELSYCSASTLGPLSYRLAHNIRYNITCAGAFSLHWQQSCPSPQAHREDNFLRRRPLIERNSNTPNRLMQSRLGTSRDLQRTSSPLSRWSIL